MKLEHKLGLVAGSLVAPGFAQAVTGHRRTAIAWGALVVLGTALATVSVWIPIGLFVLRFAALFAAIFELRRIEGRPTWWTTLSLTVFVVGVLSPVVMRFELGGFRIPSSSMYPTLEIGDHIFADKLSLAWRPIERGEVIVFHYPCDEQRDYVKRVVAVGGDTVEVRCNVVYVNGTAVPSTMVENGEQCTYTDITDEYDANARWTVKSCSRYRETLGSHTYDVFHDPERPARDARGDTLEAGDMRDFPQPDSPFAPGCHMSEFYDAPTSVRPQLAGRLVVTKPDAKACEPQVHYVVPAGGLFVLGDNRNNANDSRVWGALSTDAVVGRVTGIWLNDPPGGDRKWSRLGAIE